MGNLLLEFLLEFSVDAYWRERLKEEDNENYPDYRYLYAWRDEEAEDGVERGFLINICKRDNGWELLEDSLHEKHLTQELFDKYLGELKARWERSREPAP